MKKIIPISIYETFRILMMFNIFTSYTNSKSEIFIMSIILFFMLTLIIEHIRDKKPKN